MGQQPFVSDLKHGKAINQLRSLDKLVEILGVEGRARALFTMSGQFNIYADDSSMRSFIQDALERAYIDTPQHPMFVVKTVDSGITATLKRYDETTAESRCVFPHREKDNAYLYSDLVHETGMVKSGYHHPKGMLLLYGPGIRGGVSIADTSNLDLAPTMLAVLGLPVPEFMNGRVLEEAFAAQMAGVGSI
jgi:hypothetical protein